VGAPTILPVPDQVTPTNTPTGWIPFTVWDAETPDALDVTVTTTNPGLVQEAVVAGLGTNRSVRITPHSGAGGVAIVTLTVGDGILSANTSFNLTVYPEWGTLLAEGFNFADGPAVSVSGSKWITHSGSPEDTVQSAMLLFYKHRRHSRGIDQFNDRPRGSG
jgi:hypothetical protein